MEKEWTSLALSVISVSSVAKIPGSTIHVGLAARPRGVRRSQGSWRGQSDSKLSHSTIAFRLGAQPAKYNAFQFYSHRTPCPESVEAGDGP